MENNYDISIVIPYYKKSNIIEKILNNLDSQANISNLSTEVLVVDSHTDSDKLNLKYKKINVSVYHTINNLSAKRNYGINLSTGKVIACIDDDCVPSEFFLNEHFRNNINSETKEIFSGREVIKPLITKPKNFYKYRINNINISDMKSNKSNKGIIFRARAMNFSFHSKYKSILPTFSEEINGYGWEDTVFFNNSLEAGFKISLCDALIEHHIEETPKSYFKKMECFGYYSYMAIVKINILRLNNFNLNIFKILYRFVLPIFYPLTFIIYILFYNINILISYYLKIQSYKLHRIVYFLAILKGSSNSHQKSSRFSYN